MEHFLLQVVKKKQRVSDSSSSALLHGPRRSSDAASDVRWCGAWFGAPLLDNGVHQGQRLVIPRAASRAQADAGPIVGGVYST